MNCGTLTTKAPASMAMWRIEAIQPSLSSAVGASQICGPPSYTAPAGQRHAVLPADEPADPADAGQVDDAEVVAGADAVEHPLVHRRHQLAVPVQHAVGADDQQRVVERARPLVLALVDADGEVDAAVGAGLRPDGRPAVRRRRRSTPTSAPTARRSRGPRRGLRRPRAARVERHEALGEARPAWRRRRRPPRAGRSPCRWSPRRRGSPGSPAPRPPAPSRTSPRPQATPDRSRCERRGARACAGRLGRRSSPRGRYGRPRRPGRPWQRGSSTNGA